MKTLLLLYFLYLELGGVGQGKATILALSRYMRMSKTAMRDMLIEVDKLGYINVYETFGKGNYKVYKVALNAAGQQFLDDNWQAVQAEYHRHVAETIALAYEANSGRYAPDRKLSKKEKAALTAGQKELF